MSRKFPLNRPEGWKPQIPRSRLCFPESVQQVHILYFGIQDRSKHGHTTDGVASVKNAFESLFVSPVEGQSERTFAMEPLQVRSGFDTTDTQVWVVYWQDEHAYKEIMHRLNLRQLWETLPTNKRHDVGIWTESFSTPLDRLETNYSLLLHRPGLAKLSGTTFASHEFSGYWGAARDRLEASAADAFNSSVNEAPLPPDNRPQGLGERLVGTNYDDMCHIRSGQWWVACDERERTNYESRLEPALMDGMHHLHEHARETGNLGLRFMVNLDAEGQPIRETCGAGFFRNWADLERWSSRHKSHLAIFNGALSHAKAFGADRKFMTWHEVSILKHGEAKFEYVNCLAQTGAIGFLSLEKEALQ